jgi:hypothetical protein
MTVEAMQPGRVLRQALSLWAVAFAAIVAASLLAPPPWAKVTAVVAFLYLPLAAMRGTGQDARDYGVMLARWRPDVPLAVAMLAVIAPLFILGTRPGWKWSAPREAPPGLTFMHGSPRATAGATSGRALRHRAARGVLLPRLAPGTPEARLAGRCASLAWWSDGVLLTAALFAVGHLAIFQGSRLLVFFPPCSAGCASDRHHRGASPPRRMHPVEWWPPGQPALGPPLSRSG